MGNNTNVNSIDNNKIVYEQTCLLHRYFLGWRYKLLVGYIVIISTMGYFVLTWLKKAENNDVLLNILFLLSGAFVTFVFFLLHFRITKLIWECQNTAYKIEQDLGFNQQLGVYGSVLHPEIRERININDRNLTRMSSKVFFNPFNHFGAINWFFILMVIAYSCLFCYTPPTCNQTLKSSIKPVYLNGLCVVYSSNLHPEENFIPKRNIREK